MLQRVTGCYRLYVLPCVTGVLQRVTAHYSVSRRFTDALQRVCDSVLQSVTGVFRACYSVLHRVQTCYNVLRAHYSMLRQVAECYNVLRCVTGALQHITGCYIVLRERYRVLQRVTSCYRRVTARELRVVLLEYILVVSTTVHP